MYKDYEIKLNAILDKHGVQKTNLGVVQDLEKLNSKSETFIKTSSKIVSKMEKSFKTYNDSWEKTSQLTMKIKDQVKMNTSKIKQADKEAKNLGIKVTDIKQVAKLIETNKKLEREINMLSFPAIR